MEEAAGAEQGRQAALDGEEAEAGPGWQWGLLVLEGMAGQEVMGPESEEPVGSVREGRPQPPPGTAKINNSSCLALYTLHC